MTGFIMLATTLTKLTTSPVVIAASTMGPAFKPNAVLNEKMKPAQARVVRVDKYMVRIMPISAIRKLFTDIVTHRNTFQITINSFMVILI